MEGMREGVMKEWRGSREREEGLEKEKGEWDNK